jgi:hypothetical protein
VRRDPNYTNPPAWIYFKRARVACGRWHVCVYTQSAYLVMEPTTSRNKLLATLGTGIQHYTLCNCRRRSNDLRASAANLKFSESERVHPWKIREGHDQRRFRWRNRHSHHTQSQIPLTWNEHHTLHYRRCSYDFTHISQCALASFPFSKVFCCCCLGPLMSESDGCARL